MLRAPVLRAPVLCAPMFLERAPPMPARCARVAAQGAGFAQAAFCGVCAAGCAPRAPRSAAHMHAQTHTCTHHMHAYACVLTLTLARGAGQICDAYGANRYPFPEDLARQRQMHSEVRLPRALACAHA